MSNRLRHGRGGQLVTLVVGGFPATATERDVRAALLDRGAGRLAAVELEAAPDGPRTARVRLAWRAARKVMAAPAVEGGWPLRFRIVGGDQAP